MLPLIPIVIAVCAIGAAFAIAELIKWLKIDPNRDVVMFLGPKEGGKTECMSAMRQEEFNQNRTGTGVRVDRNKFKLDEADFGVKKMIAFDSGGEENNIKNYCNKVFDYVDSKKPDYLLLVLVADVSKINQDNVNDTADEIAIYLNCIHRICEKTNNCEKTNKFNKTKEAYENGRCGYSILWTHGDAMKKNELEANKALLSIVQARVDKKKGKVRNLNKENRIFDLSQKPQRDDVIKFVAEGLKTLHG